MSNIILNRILYDNFFVRWKNHLIRKDLLKRSKALNIERGMPMAVFANDVIGIDVSLYGLYEKEHLEDLKNILQKTNTKTNDSTAIDIGANIGNHSLNFSLYFNKVICFEPNPRALSLLNANTNQIKNIEVYGWGCGMSHQKLILYEDFTNIGNTSSKYNFKNDNNIEITIKPLDDMLDTLNSVSLIKIDVEGMELDVLKGADRVISKFNPVICFEQHEAEFSSSEETPSINWLRFKDYRIFGLKKKNRSYILRIINNIKKLFFGIKENREIIEHEKVPKSHHEALYAIHSSSIKN